MLFARVPLFLGFVHYALGAQPNAPAPIAAPLRELPWGQLNFLHTTDTHGWHGGHLQEAQYSADWGDYISFTKHLQDKADADGSDLLLIDTGDRVEGNGLYDASNPKGKYTFDIFREQRIDVITSGNHELYLQNSSDNEYYKTVPDFKDNYVASNLDIYNPETGKLEPLAPRYRKFTTKNQGIRIVAFGFLFDFKGNANNTVVQPVEESIKEKWFQDAIRERDVDLFLVAGHVQIRDSREYEAIFKAIRDVHWDTPIQFFGGHYHIRDYRKFDKKSYGLASGRYMETIGFMSLSGLGHEKRSGMVEQESSGLKFERRYIDNNLFSLYHHSNKNDTTFHTEHGRNVSAAIDAAREALHLDKAYGCAPHDYWLNRAPYPADDSILTWLENEVLPDTARTFAASDKPQLIITNSGAMRFDIFEGPFTIDTTFLVSPFTSGFRMIKDVPYSAANRVLKLLNNEGQILLTDLMSLSEQYLDLGAFGPHMLSQLAPPMPPVGLKSLQSPIRTYQHNGIPQDVLSNGKVHFTDDSKLTPGYTTVDDAGNDGDDTLHQQIQFYDVPNCISADVAFDPKSPPETVDLVYNEFIERWVLLALRYLGLAYSVEDTHSTMDGKSFTEVISDWIEEHWECKEH
ncbi:hypothetical protein H2203_000610 [Taxawa tesnikishii (nom. ined.)]|nr:hypothetical protein H2203_000610 [Dothideales sp. JES 119]